MIRGLVSITISGVVIGEMWNGHGTRTIGAYLLLVALVWAAVAGLAALFIIAAFGRTRTFAELPSREYADEFCANLSGSDLPVGNGNPTRNPEPDTTLLAVVDATRPTRRTERRASHPYTSPDDQERATARTLRIVP